MLVKLTVEWSEGDKQVLPRADAKTLSALADILLTINENVKISVEKMEFETEITKAVKEK